LPTNVGAAAAARNGHEWGSDYVHSGGDTDVHSATPSLRKGQGMEGCMNTDEAILALLGAAPELYPRGVAARLGLGTDAVAAALERLYAGGRVGRLWNRYLLPDAVPAVRARWLRAIDAHCARLEAEGAAPGTCDRAREVVRAWEGRD
jgi:hypothetical protein